MDQQTMLIMGVSVATNIIFIKWKIEKERYSDAILDGTIFISLVMIFSNTVSGLSIATLASSLISIYLFFSPPKEFFNIKSFKKKKKNRNNKEIWEKYQKAHTKGQ